MQKLKLQFIFFLLLFAFRISVAATFMNAPALKGFNIDDKLMEQDFIDMKSLNVKLVRVSFPREPFLEPVPPYNIREKPFAILDKYLVWAKKYQLQIIVDPHYFPGMAGKYSTVPQDSVWTDDVAQQAIANFWGKLAKRYSTASAQIYGYDLFNEAAMPEIVSGLARCDFYNKFILSIVFKIRQSDKNVSLVVQFPFALNSAEKATNQMDAVNCLAPISDPNIIYSFHMYDPGRFTHQGVLPGFEKGVRLVGNGDDKKLRAYLTERMRPVLEFQKKNLARIYVGEFGVSEFAGMDGDRYVNSLTSIFEEYGWDWTYHSFREAAVWDPEMQESNVLSTRNTDSPKMKLLKDALSR